MMLRDFLLTQFDCARSSFDVLSSRYKKVIVVNFTMRMLSVSTRQQSLPQNMDAFTPLTLSSEYERGRRSQGCPRWLPHQLINPAIVAHLTRNREAV